MPGKVNQGSSYSSTLEALIQGYHPQDFTTEAKHWAQSMLKPGWQFYPEAIKSISQIDLSHLGEDAVKLWHLSEQAIQSSYATFTHGSSTDKAYLVGQWAHTGTSLAANLLLFKGMGVVAESSMATRVGGLLEKANISIQKEFLGSRLLNREGNLPNFASLKLLEDHFEKHTGEFKGAFHNPMEYLAGAHDVIKGGIKVAYDYKGETRIGYIRFAGTSDGKPIIGDIRQPGVAKFEFVGTNNIGHITTYHIESKKDFWKMINCNSYNKNIEPYSYIKPSAG